MSQKISKEELKGQDAFLTASARALDFVEHHGKVFFAVIIVVILGGIAYAAAGYLGARKERLAAEAIYPSEAELKKVQGPTSDPMSMAPRPQIVDDYNGKVAPLVAKVEAQIQAHSDTKTAIVSAMNLSYFLVQQKRFAEAMKVLDIPKASAADSDLLLGLWDMHRGMVYLENRETEKALAIYQSVVKLDRLKLFHSEALLKIGYCHELTGDLTKARESYEKVEREFPNTEAAQSAQQSMRVMQLKTPRQG